MRRKITANVQLQLKPASAIDAAAVASLVNAAFRRYAILMADRTSATAATPATTTPTAISARCGVRWRG